MLQPCSYVESKLRNMYICLEKIVEFEVILCTEIAKVDVDI